MEENQLPRPTQEIYEELQIVKKGNNDDRYLEIMNNYNWAVELFENNGKFGIKNWDGTILLPPAFDDFRMMTSGLYEMGDKMAVFIDNKEGIVKMDGENWSWLLKPEFDFISYPSSIIAVKKGSFWGIINLMTSEYMVKPELDEVHLHGGGFLFVNGIGIFKKGNKYGVVNDYGGITEIIFDEISLDYDGMLSVRKDELWGWVNENGQFELDEDLASWAWDI